MITLPCIASPCPASPCPASPCLAFPCYSQGIALRVSTLPASEGGDCLQPSTAGDRWRQQRQHGVAARSAGPHLRVAWIFSHTLPLLHACRALSRVRVSLHRRSNHPLQSQCPPTARSPPRTAAAPNRVLSWCWADMCAPSASHLVYPIRLAPSRRPAQRWAFFRPAFSPGRPQPTSVLSNSSPAISPSPWTTADHSLADRRSASAVATTLLLRSPRRYSPAPDCFLNNMAAPRGVPPRRRPFAAASDNHHRLPVGAVRALVAAFLLVHCAAPAVAQGIKVASGMPTATPAPPGMVGIAVGGVGDSTPTPTDPAATASPSSPMPAIDVPSPSPLPTPATPSPSPSPVPSPAPAPPSTSASPSLHPAATVPSPSPSPSPLPQPAAASPAPIAASSPAPSPKPLVRGSVAAAVVAGSWFTLPGVGNV